jgi:hypothetical protein
VNDELSRQVCSHSSSRWARCWPRGRELAHRRRRQPARRRDQGPRAAGPVGPHPQVEAPLVAVAAVPEGVEAEPIRPLPGPRS